MPVGRGPVAGLLEGAQELDADGVPVFAVFEAGEQLHHFGAVGQVANLEAVTGKFFPQRTEFFGVRIVMDAAHMWDRAFVECGGDTLIGEEHELFDQLVRFIVFYDLGAIGPAVFIAIDFNFLHVQVERPGAETFSPQGLPDTPEVVDHALDEVQFGISQFRERPARRASLVGRRRREGANLILGEMLEEAVGLLVGEALDAADDRVGELGLHEPCLAREFADDRLHESVFGFDERAQAAGERVREHRDHRTHKVSRVAALAGFNVERRASLHVGRDVGDMDTYADIAVRHALDGERVVEVLGVIRVDGDGRDRAEILTANAISLLHALGEGVGFGGDRGWELGVEAVATENREVFGHRRMRDAEDFGDGASRAEVAAFPGVEADDDFVAGLGRGEESGPRRVAHDDFA